MSTNEVGAAGAAAPDDELAWLKLPPEIGWDTTEGATAINTGAGAEAGGSSKASRYDSAPSLGP
ncbi:MAG: hypothetical protein HOO04_04155 [Phycisphaerae bacterium]|nr:hypothetical protein [Phycisphaerae bacterium]